MRVLLTSVCSDTRLGLSWTLIEQACLSRSYAYVSTMHGRVRIEVAQHEVPAVHSTASEWG